MAVPHYTYLVLKMPGPKGIITVKGSFELSDLCDKEFHKMAQNFGMMASYREPKAKARLQESRSNSKETPKNQKQRNLGYSRQNRRCLQEKKRRLKRHRRTNRVEKYGYKSHELFQGSTL
jgi:hypothetical protein